MLGLEPQMVMSCHGSAGIEPSPLVSQCSSALIPHLLFDSICLIPFTFCHVDFQVIFLQLCFGGLIACFYFQTLFVQADQTSFKLYLVCDNSNIWEFCLAMSAALFLIILSHVVLFIYILSFF